MKTKSLYTTALAITIGVIAVGVYFMFSPESSIYFPKCIFHALTGYDCPGCGSQRAVHSLLHLEFKSAFYYNPLLIISIPYILVGIYLEHLGGRAKHPKFRNLFYGHKAILVVFTIVMLYWIGRNIF